jgi:hypothetical protein
VEEEWPYSSGAYRIDAVRILGEVMNVIKNPPPMDERDDELYETADNHLNNWRNLLPDTKKRIIGREGIVDEVLFEAHMIVAAYETPTHLEDALVSLLTHRRCSILLHRPRSDLAHEEVKDITSCVNRGPMADPSYRKELNTLSAMSAARDICVLIKMPCPLVRHTPFFTCAVTMAAVVYLSYWSFVALEGGDGPIKEHIRLNIGVLKQLSTTLPMAKIVLGQVRGVARELFESKKAKDNWLHGNVTREEIFQGMIEEVPQETQIVPNGFVYPPLGVT